MRAIKVLSLIAVFLFSTGLAQSRTVTGTVTDEDGEPVDYMQCVLLAADSSYVASSLTGENGKFSIEDPAGSGTLLRVYGLSYTEKFLPVPASGDMGRISVSFSGIALKEVVVKGHQPVTTLRKGALVTRVENTYLSQLGTADRVVGHVPLVTGRDGQFTVLGRGTPAIYVNNRLVRDNSELEQISSADIRSIEVITNPGATYSASVGSVIRINVRRRQEVGWSGSGRIAATVDRYVSNSDILNLNYRNGGLDLFFNGRFSDVSDRTITNSSQIKTGRSDWWQRVDAVSYDNKKNMSGRLGVNYYFNRRHSVGAYYQHGRDKTDGHGRYTSDITDGQVRDLWNSQERSTAETDPKSSANIYYDGNVAGFGIKFDADYMFSSSESSSSSRETAAADPTVIRDVISASESSPRLWAEKLVLERNVAGFDIEAGQEFTSSRNLTKYSDADDIIDDSDVEIKERNMGVFGTISRSMGKVEVGAGLRYEHVESDYFDNGVRNDERSRTYNNYFPSLRLDAMLGNLQLSVNYSDKTARPSYSSLSGSTVYLNRVTYKRGNPDLRPSRISSFNLTAVWGNLIFQGGYTHRNRSVLTVMEPYKGNDDINLITYTNSREYDEMSLVAVWQGNVGIWHPESQIGITKQWFTLSDGYGRNFGRPLIHAELRNSLKLPYGVWLNLDMSYQSGGYHQNIFVYEKYGMDISLARRFLKNRITVFAEFNDIFDKMQSPYKIYSHDNVVRESNKRLGRNFRLTVSFNFNEKKSKYKGKGAGATEKGRLAE